MAKRKKIEQANKQFSGYIDGDDEIRKQIFSYKPATQQIVFELFSCIDQAYYTFFQILCAVPSTLFWDLLTARLSAVASSTDRNRNFCEDYSLLDTVQEDASKYKLDRAKVVNLIGAAHGLWYSLADTEYSTSPDTLSLWRILHTLHPSRVVWEWWLDDRVKELKKLLAEHRYNLSCPYVINEIEDWMQDSFGLIKPRSHWQVILKYLLETSELVQSYKEKIAAPYLRLVYSVAKGVAAYNQPDQFPDTYAIGVTGLMRGIAKYAPSMSLAFPTFIEREVRYEIYYQICNYNVIILPHTTWQQHRKFEDMRENYHSKHGKELTISEFIDTFHLDRELVYDIYSQISMQNPSSLDQSVYMDEESPCCINSSSDFSLKDKIEDPQIKDTQNLLEDQELLLLALNRLPITVKRFFIFSHNLCELVHDSMPPNLDELKTFFLNQAHNNYNKMSMPICRSFF